MILGYDIFSNKLEDINLEKKLIINTINPHSYCIAKKDEVFQQALKSSDILLPDGIGIVWAAKFLRNFKLKKIAGFDLFIFLMNDINKKNGSVYFLGSTENTLKLISEKIVVEYPKINFKKYSPPFKDEFSHEESLEICNRINDFSADILFVGMTAPKQEKWIHKYKNEINVKKICAVGAVFDFYAGNIKRSSNFWISIGLEWLPRFLREPKRLYKRTFFSTPKFILEVLFHKLFGKGIL
ncbi:WecB/TagA/CpsF family glycosyltransferase [Bacteroidota bacterium]|nr:WecB/TagA/CpsF family glycosyltransferase [Bacteroidota bacterium]MDC3114856.1 WecB/TagA/CpsF family glycosyltransferase [Bacteroidota bacterium]MDC3229721.1 WecB/TagA/CpsF family glycosyltransferase [Bacteroidota bacterium]